MTQSVVFVFVNDTLSLSLLMTLWPKAGKFLDQRVEGAVKQRPLSIAQKEGQNPVTKISGLVTLNNHNVYPHVEIPFMFNLQQSFTLTLVIIIGILNSPKLKMIQLSICCNMTMTLLRNSKYFGRGSIVRNKTWNLISFYECYLCQTLHRIER